MYGSSTRASSGELSAAVNADTRARQAWRAEAGREAGRSSGEGRATTVASPERDEAVRTLQSVDYLRGLEAVNEWGASVSRDPVRLDDAEVRPCRPFRPGRGSDLPIPVE